MLIIEQVFLNVRGNFFLMFEMRGLQEAIYFQRM